jgi:hypothetical protein
MHGSECKAAAGQHAIKRSNAKRKAPAFFAHVRDAVDKAAKLGE